VGNSELLDRHGVVVKHELSGVGENLQDHLQLRPSFRLKKGTLTMNQLANSVVGKADMGTECVAPTLLCTL
jgi:choline dehydrogenase